MNTIPLSEVKQDLHHPVTQAVLGQIVSRVYEGEEVQRHHFEAAGKDITKPYKLGPTTTQFEFFDWPDLMAPVLEQGYSIEKLHLSRGGLRAHIIFSNKDLTYKDPIGWDKGVWGASKTLYDSVVFNGGIKPGNGFHYRRGFFRQVCTNGLVLETMAMGSGSYNHSNFKPESLAEALFGQVLGGPETGPVIGHSKGLQKAVQLIGTERPSNMPLFLNEFVNPLEGITGEFATEAVQQFELLCQNKKEIQEIDIANALTSAANLLQKAPDRLPHQLLNIQKSITRLTGIYSL